MRHQCKGLETKEMPRFSIIGTCLDHIEQLYLLLFFACVFFSYDRTNCIAYHPWKWLFTLE